MSERSLMAYALGLVAFIGVKVLIPGFYGRHDIKTPVRIAIIAMATNLVLSLMLMWPLGHAGLALATIIAALLNAGLLLKILLRQGVYRPLPGWGLLLARSLMACGIMGVLLWLASGPTSGWIGLSGGEGTLRLGLLLLLGAGSYAIAGLVLGLRPRHFMVVPRHP
jgi:putative peptidoglycan lipid II flippase